MKQGLHVIADISGSMAELGKSGLLRDLCRFISQYWAYLSDHAKGDLHIYAWSCDIAELDTAAGKVIPDLVPSGRTDIAILSPLIESAARNGVPLLLLSDGSFPCEKLKELLCSAETKPDLYALAVGADADELSLASIACDKKSWKPEEIEILLSRIPCRPNSVPPVDSIIFSAFPVRSMHIEKDEWDD